MIARRTTYALSAALGLCTLFGSLAASGDALAYTRVRRYTPAVVPFAACSVNYGTITDSVAYNGGPVISNVQAIPVFWTSAVDPAIVAWAPGYLATLVDSAYLDLLSQYSSQGQSGGTGQTIGRGSSAAGVTITPIQATGSTVDDSAIGPELQAQIAANRLPAPVKDAQGYPNTVYVLFFPQGITVNYGGPSCGSWCGYHGSVSGQFTYAVVPDMGTGSACATGCSDSCTTGNVAVSTGTVSHELAEAISDPDNPPGWINPNQSANNFEIGDICVGNTSADTDVGPVPGTSVSAQYEWSQRDHQCLLANPGVDAGSSSSSSGSSSGGSSGSGSGSSSGSGSGSGSSSGGSSGGGSGGSNGSGSGSGSGSSSGSSSGGSSGGGSGGLGSSSGGSSGGSSGSSSSSGAGASDAGASNSDSSPSGSSSGCGCGLVGGGASGSAGLAGLGLLALGVRRRRRRR